MSATDELRKLLDERGVEWKARPDGVTEWVNDGMTCKAVDRTTVGIEHLTLLVPVLTPEQAIAATLGRGTLTADDVRDLIERHSDASGGNGRDFHNGAYVAIADELNATLGAGTCKVVGSYYSELMDVYVFSFSCRDTIWWNDVEPPNYCPECGRKVEQ